MSKKMRLWMAGTVGVLMAGFMSVSVYALEEKDVIGTWYVNELSMGEGASFHPGAMGMEVTVDIKEDGKMETFAPTDETKIKCSNEKPFKLIKSRLPIKESFKIGISGMKAKPIRLVITILLCFVCFTMFGIVDSFAVYNSKTAIVNSMYYGDIKYTTFKKMVEIDNYGEQYFLEKKYQILI